MDQLLQYKVIAAASDASKKQETRKSWYKFWIKRTKPPEQENDAAAFLSRFGSGF